MKRIGVLGAISPQATMDFEVRVRRVAQRLKPEAGRGYWPETIGYQATRI